MDVYCTCPSCRDPVNSVADFDDPELLKTVSQKFCLACGMPLILAGRYLPLGLLGQGEVGATFLAGDRYTPQMQLRTVKQFQLSQTLSPRQVAIARRLWEREATALERLGDEHPQIPRLFAFFSLSVSLKQPEGERQFFYLVREFIDGQTLRQQLQRQGRFRQSQVLRILREILPVLQFVHDRGTVHQGIKPSNLLRGGDGRLDLLDFGAFEQVAMGAMRLRRADANAAGIEQLSWAPPERVVGGRVYPATDLYALAVTCLILLTGKEPGDLFDTGSNQWNWRTDVQLSPPLEGVLDRLLLPIPDMRFASAGEVMEALTRKVTPPSLPVPLSPSFEPTSLAPAATKRPAPGRSAFSMLELLAIAAFTGFEATLLAIAARNLLDSPGLSMGLWGMTVGGLLVAQFRRWIKPVDLLIVAGTSAASFALFPFLRAPLAIELVLVTAIAVGVSFVALTALLCLIYQLFSRIL